MNKFDLMNKVNVSRLDAKDKILLVELILRSDETGECYPTVARLCQVRGISHEKNFKGIENYLGDYVLVKRETGKRNHYFLNVPAIMALEPAVVTLKDTPKRRQANHPAPADNHPAVEGPYHPASAGEDSPAVEGTNNTFNNTSNSSKESTASVAAGASPLAKSSSLVFHKEESPLVTEQSKDHPSSEGESVSKEQKSQNETETPKKKFGDWTEAELAKAASAMMGWDEELNETQEKVLERMRQTGKPFPISDPVDVALRYEKEAY